MSIVNEFFKVDKQLEELLYLALEQAEETGTPPDDLQDLILAKAKNREWFISQMGNWYLRAKARLEAREAEYKPIQDRIKADIKVINREMETALFFLRAVFPPAEDAEIANDDVYIIHSKSESVRVVKEELLPLEFCRTKIEADKTLLKAALKKGKEIPGAVLEVVFNPRISPGGDAAKRRLVVRKNKREKGGVDDE